MRIQQRFLTDAIAGEKRSCVRSFPNHESKHAAQVFGTVSSELIVSMNDRFGVAVGVEGVTELFQLLAQLEIVVDLAVENDPGAAIVIVNQLLTTLQVDDREAAHRHSDRAVDVETILVRTAMPEDRVVHPRQQLLVNRVSVVSNDASNATHNYAFCLSRSSRFSTPAQTRPRQR